MDKWTIFQLTICSTQQTVSSEYRTRGKPPPTSYLSSHLIKVLTLVISYSDKVRTPKQTGLPEQLRSHPAEEIGDGDDSDSKHSLGVLHSGQYLIVDYESSIPFCYNSHRHWRLSIP